MVPVQPAPLSGDARSRRWPRLRVAGVVLAVVATVVAVVCVVMIVLALARPLGQTLASPSRPTPVDETLPMEAGRYTVFELTGHTSQEGVVTTTESGTPTVTPQQVTVSGPGQSPVEISGLGSSSETLARGEDLYVGMARFRIQATGDYRVQVTSPTPATVIVAPSFGSGLGSVTGWVLAGGISGVVLLLALIMIAASFSGRRSPPENPRQTTAQGWYHDPHGTGGLRYFDGETWTTHSRPVDGR